MAWPARGFVRAASMSAMRGIWWAVLVTALLGTSSVAFAEDAKPKPGIEMSLAERGPCSVKECGEIERPTLKRDVSGGPNWRKNMRFGDPRRPDFLLRLHYELFEKLRQQQRTLDKVSALLAACEAAER